MMWETPPVKPCGFIGVYTQKPALKSDYHENPMVHLFTLCFFFYAYQNILKHVPSNPDTIIIIIIIIMIIIIISSSSSSSSSKSPSSSSSSSSLSSSSSPVSTHVNCGNTINFYVLYSCGIKNPL